MAKAPSSDSEQTIETLLNFPTNPIKASLVLSPDSKGVILNLPISFQASISLSNDSLLKPAKDVENITKGILSASEKIIDNFRKAAEFFSTGSQKELSSLISKNLMTASVLIASSLQESRTLLTNDPVKGSKFITDKLVQATELIFKKDVVLQSSASEPVIKNIPKARVKPIVSVAPSNSVPIPSSSRPTFSVTSTSGSRTQTSTLAPPSQPSGIPSISPSTPVSRPASSYLESLLSSAPRLPTSVTSSTSSASSSTTPFRFSNRSDLNSFDFLNEHRANSSQARLFGSNLSSLSGSRGSSGLCQYCNERRVSEFTNYNMHLVTCLRKRYPRGTSPHSTCGCGYWLPTHIPDGERIFGNHAARCRGR